MKGVARVNGEYPADYEAVVLALSRLSHAVLTEHDTAGALNVASETGAVLLQTDSAAAFLIDHSTDTLQMAARYHLPGFDAKVIPAESVVRECIKSGSPVLVANANADRRKGMSALAKRGIVSVLAVPIAVDDDNMGALAVMSSTLKAFSASDIEVLSAIANQAAFVAFKGRTSSNPLMEKEDINVGPTDVALIELANQKIQELAIINRVSEAVIATLDLKELLELALDQCLLSIGAGVGSIMLVDDETNLLTIKAAQGLAPEVVNNASVQVGEGIAGWVAAHGQPVLVHDARTDPRFRMSRYRDDITSAMSVPLKARDRVIGVLNASTIEPGHKYGPRDVEFLSTVANQVAMALDNARLYERLDRRSAELESLLEISQAITSTLELKEIVELLSDKFLAIADADVCALLAYDAENDRFRYLNGHGLTVKDRRSRYLELAASVAAEMMRVQGPVCGDVAPDSPFSNVVTEDEGLLSVVCIPLTASDKVVAAVALFSADPRDYTAAELATLSALGGLAGVAIHNSFIYQHKYDIARSLQFQLVPKVPLFADGLDIGHKYLPAREVGGDYYDVIDVAPGRSGLVIADVAGNSVGAAVYTSMGKYVLKAHAVEDDPPADVLAKLNRIACDDTNPEVFISLLYGVFDASDRTFRFACAGHEPPLLHHPDGSFESLRAQGVLVGIKRDVEYEEKTVQLEPGSVLVFFTDGLIEAPTVRGKFGLKEINDIVKTHKLKSAQELADNIYTTLTEMAGCRIQDDVALVVLKIK